MIRGVRLGNAHDEMQTGGQEMPDNETIKVCNKENGSFSQLWGRDCWVADSVLKLVEAAFDPGEYRNQSKGAREVCQAVENYCKELRQLNREPYFADVVWTPERPL
jgi:hypothetical protein